jgi:hypothetical protein
VLSRSGEKDLPVQGWKDLQDYYREGMNPTGGNYKKLGSVEILVLFFSTLLGATARNAFAPAAVASPLER